MVAMGKFFRVFAAALVLTVVVSTTACAQQTPSTGSAAPDATSAAPSASGEIDLTIELTEAPGAAARQFRLIADGSTPAAGSTLPDPAAALAAVEQHGEKMFFPVPAPNRVCTEQYGGPQVAVVTGSFRGKAVNATFKRTNGCEISSWQALAPLFGSLAGAAGAI